MSRRNLNGYVSTNWGGGNSIEIDNYLTIVALEDGLTASLSTNACEYCVDGDGNWKTLAAATNTEAINKGQTLSFRGNNLTSNFNNGIGTFTISKSCNLEGNCMSMWFGDDAANNISLSGKNYAFKFLFRNCTTIKSVSSGFLPATTLETNCYYYMFDGCTSLTQTPALPATTLADSCYYCMFYGCTSLSTPPELPARTLASQCYYMMFSHCTNLTITPELPATTLANSCYGYMFRRCARLTKTPSLPATTLADSCYYCMFASSNILPDCSNINFSSASVVSSGGLQGLFCGTKVTDEDLERILPKNGNGKYCLPVTTLVEDCYRSMFANCTSLTTAPELPATTLKKYCYYSMFEGCSKLNYIKAMFTTTPSKYSNYTTYWVEGVASTGTFVKNKNASWNVTATSSNSYIGIPSGWTIQKA